MANEPPKAPPGATAGDGSPARRHVQFDAAPPPKAPTNARLQAVSKATTQFTPNVDKGMIKEMSRRKSAGGALRQTGEALHAARQRQEELVMTLSRRMSLDVQSQREFLIDVESTWKQVLEQEDTDGDCKITVLDQGPKVISLRTLRSGGSSTTQVRGTYALSILLQELAMARELGHKRIILDEGILRENPVDRLSRLIREMFWDGLRRTVDEEGISRVVVDPKNSKADHSPRVYVPYDDPLAKRYFTALSKRMNGKLEVVELPKDLTPEYVKSINLRPGILTLALRRRSADSSTETFDIDSHSFEDLDADAAEAAQTCACVMPEDKLGSIVVSVAESSRMNAVRTPMATNLDSVEPAADDGTPPHKVPKAVAEALAMTDDHLLDNFEGVPFIVPGGRFNEMYGWDSYFEALGLICDGHVELARGMVDNFVYEICHYHKILNANRSYYLTRSQPPFLTDMALQVFRRLSPDRPEFNCRWLTRVMRAAIKEYHMVWMSQPRYVPSTGLSRYYDPGIGMPPETEATHFNVVMSKYAAQFGMDREAFTEAYNNGQVKVPELDLYFAHDRSLRESGHDTTYRLDGRSAFLVPVDLNALLYRYEIDIAETIRVAPEVEVAFLAHLESARRLGQPIARDLFGGRFVLKDGTVETPEAWFAAAARRKEAMNRHCWNEKKGMYFDYNVVENAQIDYESATTVFPLWAGMASPEQAKAVIAAVVSKLEMSGGIVSGTEESRGQVNLDRPNRQWDYPFGWAPHQILAWEGFLRYGAVDDAQRLAYRWLYMITRSFVDFNGTVPEKYDVVARTHKFHVEYGNVGTDFAYITREGFSWMNASFQLGLNVLDCSQRRALGAMVPPEELYVSVRRPPAALVAAKEELVRKAVEGQEPTSAGGTIDTFDRRSSWNPARSPSGVLNDSSEAATVQV